MVNRQILSFYMGENLFGVNIILIREIIHNPAIAPVNLSPKMVRGLLNLRGQIVTIIDPSVTLGMERLGIGPDAHCIILKTCAELVNRADVTDTPNNMSNDIVGLLIDSIGEVYEIAQHDVDPPPANLNGIDGNYLSGVIKLDNNLMMLLKDSHVLSQ